jgi:hypothetical protein
MLVDLRVKCCGPFLAALTSRYHKVLDVDIFWTAVSLPPKRPAKIATKKQLLLVPDILLLLS